MMVPERPGALRHANTAVYLIEPRVSASQSPQRCIFPAEGSHSPRHRRDPAKTVRAVEELQHSLERIDALQAERWNESTVGARPLSPWRQNRQQHKMSRAALSRSAAARPRTSGGGGAQPWGRPAGAAEPARPTSANQLARYPRSAASLGLLQPPARSEADLAPPPAEVAHLHSLRGLPRRQTAPVAAPTGGSMGGRQASHGSLGRSLTRGSLDSSRPSASQPSLLGIGRPRGYGPPASYAPHRAPRGASYPRAPTLAEARHASEAEQERRMVGELPEPATSVAADPCGSILYGGMPGFGGKGLKLRGTG